MTPQRVDYVTRRIRHMEDAELWPNGPRYLWTDSFGLLLYLSLFDLTREPVWLTRAQALVEAVYRVLGRPQGLRIGEEAGRDGQYFHYLSKWIYALGILGRYLPGYRDEAIRLAKQIHACFVVPGRGVIWKMREDLTAPYPGFGCNAIDALEGWVVYRLLAPDALAAEIAELAALAELNSRDIYIDVDLGLGMALWLGHFFPDAPWASRLTRASRRRLASLWTDPPGYFCRQPHCRQARFAFSNYGISLGLQAQQLWPRRVRKLNRYFEGCDPADPYAKEAITHVMACTSHLPGLWLSDRPCADERSQAQTKSGGE